MIKIGVIGAGGNTISAHLPKLIEQKDVEVIAVANRTILSGSKVAKKFNIKHVYDDWQKVIMNDEVDAICIGTWPNMHAAITIEALESGKHVLTEARMAMDSDEAEIMFNVSKNYPELITQIVPAPHTLPYDNTIKDWVSKEMGDLILFDVKSTTGEFIDYDREIHWRENRDLSGNNIMHMGIFYESAMRWLGTASSVMAVSNVNVKKRPSSETGIWSWITTVDHKRIGIMYGYAAFFFLLVGGLEALLLRIQLSQPDNNFLTAAEYNAMFTMHGTTMIFLAIMPISAAFFNYLLPLQIGARDVAFPRLNALSFWIFIFGGAFLYSTFIFGTAGAQEGGRARFLAAQ